MLGHPSFTILQQLQEKYFDAEWSVAPRGLCDSDFCKAKQMVSVTVPDHVRFQRWRREDHLVTTSKTLICCIGFFLLAGRSKVALFTLMETVLSWARVHVLVLSDAVPHTSWNQSTHIASRVQKSGQRCSGSVSQHQKTLRRCAIGASRSDIWSRRC